MFIVPPRGHGQAERGAERYDGAARPGQTGRERIEPGADCRPRGIFQIVDHAECRLIGRLPAARRQVPVTLGGRRRYLDNLYQDYLLAVELDGAAAHPVTERWRDIRRDNSLAGLGMLTLRYSWSDVTSQRCQVAAQIAGVLAQRGWPGPVRRCSPRCPVAPS